MNTCSSSLSAESQCVLCASCQTIPFYQDRNLEYFRCTVCLLVFLAPKHRLSPVEEKARYETHENDPEDEKYRSFLNRLMQPLLSHLPVRGKGLDFGSGPGPTLSVMFEELEYEMSIYDPFFAPTPEVLSDSYDFITCTEVVEHLYNPAKSFQLFDAILKSGGHLGIMTEELEERNFKTWYYRTDPTHVAFYSKKTFEWISKAYGWALEYPRKNIFIFRKT